MIYCPRCDKRITPDHRCLSRRHFLGALGAAALSAIVAPAPWKVWRAPRSGEALFSVYSSDCTMTNRVALYLTNGTEHYGIQITPNEVKHIQTRLHRSDMPTDLTGLINAVSPLRAAGE